ncbi:MAG: SDR family oxidoreductase [Actinomycetota bacterium]|nr:SDR family oxidoreductase [Actinomycetota bacterium]
MDLGLAGVAAAVAGASRGLGYAIAMQLAQEGARVAICSRSRGDSERAASAIASATGVDVEGFEADVATAAGAESFVSAAAERFGGLQVLVTNAGGPPAGPVTDFDDDDWMKAIDLNLMSAVRMVRAALPHLQANPWSRVLLITSTAVKQPIANLGLSNSVRAATTGFAKTLAGEVGAAGTTVNCILPGLILTDRLRSLAGAPPDAGPDHPALAEIARRSPLGRVGTPEEFASVAAFFCSSRSSFVHGVSLQVDGGSTKALL